MSALFPEFRKCPECGERGVLTAEIRPAGTQCRHCLKVIENDIAFGSMVILSLIVVMSTSFYFDIGSLGVISAILLIVFGGPMKWSHSCFLPLKHYQDD